MITKVTISKGSIKATTDGEAWTCKDKPTLRMLSTFARREDVTEYTPSYAYSMAMLAEDLIGAMIINVEDDGKKEPEGVIY